MSEDSQVTEVTEQIEEVPQETPQYLVGITDRYKIKFLKEFIKSRALLATAAAKANISRTAVYEWKKNDPLFADAVKEIEEMEFDKVENRMLERINDGSDTMMIWFSKTRMKNRGYVERFEQAGVKEQPIETSHTHGFDVSNLPDGLVEAIATLLNRPK